MLVRLSLSRLYVVTRRNAWIAVAPLLLSLLAMPIAHGQCFFDERFSSEILIEPAPGVPIETILARYDLTLVDSIPQWNFFEVGVIVPPGEDPDMFVDAVVLGMEMDLEILRAEPHRLSETPEGVQVSLPDLGIVADSQTFRTQPATQTVNTQAAHTRYSGSGITVAVVDTGMSLAHPETSSRVTGPGTDFADGDGTAQAQANGVDEDGDGMTDESLHHGTFVSGLVNLVAPDATVLPIRTLDAEGRGRTFALAKGILDAIQHGVDVISLSESMLHGSRPVERAIEDALDAGIVVVVAAGNRGLNIVDATIINDCRSFPASLPGVITVAAVDGGLVKAPFSDYGPDVDLSAPGIDLISTFGDTDFAQWGGTSFAAPLVAGGVALILEKYPGLTPSELRMLLGQTAQPDNNPPSLDGLMGAGVLDVDSLTSALSSDRSSVTLSIIPEGTTLAWSPVLDAVHYDVARGNVANLGRIGPSAEQVDLGPLFCVANDSIDPSTAASPDPDIPGPGKAFFYVVRDEAPDPGGGSYGTADDGDPRIAGVIDCPSAP